MNHKILCTRHCFSASSAGFICPATWYQSLGFFGPLSSSLSSSFLQNPSFPLFSPFISSSNSFLSYLFPFAFTFSFSLYLKLHKRKQELGRGSRWPYGLAQPLHCLGVDWVDIFSIWRILGAGLCGFMELRGSFIGGFVRGFYHIVWEDYKFASVESCIFHSTYKILLLVVAYWWA